MAEEEDERVLHVQAVRLEDDPSPWTPDAVEQALSGLRGAGIEPAGGGGPAGAAEAAVKGEPVRLTSSSGVHRLTLEADGGWWFDTPGDQLTVDGYEPDAGAISTVVDAVRALVAERPPYVACTWFSTQAWPHWIHEDRPFRVEDGKAILFLSDRYLAAHHGGVPFEDPPVAVDERLAGGQLLVCDGTSFATGVSSGPRPLGDYLQANQDDGGG